MPLPLKKKTSLCLPFLSLASETVPLPLAILVLPIFLYLIVAVVLDLDDLLDDDLALDLLALHRLGLDRDRGLAARDLDLELRLVADLGGLGRGGRAGEAAVLRQDADGELVTDLRLGRGVRRSGADHGGADQPLVGERRTGHEVPLALVDRDGLADPRVALDLGPLGGRDLRAEDRVEAADQLAGLDGDLRGLLEGRVLPPLGDVAAGVVHEAHLVGAREERAGLNVLSASAPAA